MEKIIERGKKIDKNKKEFNFMDELDIQLTQLIKLTRK